MTEFDLSKLYSTNELHAKEVSACGHKFTVYVRRLPAVDLRKLVAETQSDDREERATAGFNALVKSIRNEDGTAFATFEQYKKLDAEAIKALMAVFEEVNKQREDSLGNG